MTVSKSFPTQDPGGQPITDTRRVLAGLIARNADGTPRPGILPPVATALVAGRASMAYDVAPFIAATARFNNGIELVANDALVQVATDPAPNANSRIDVIYVRSRFLQHADGSNLVELAVAKGLAAAIPQKPPIPAGALELGWATVPSTATTTLSNGVVITQTHPFTAAAGGTVWVRNAAEMAAWIPAAGSSAYRLDNGQTYEYRTIAIGAPSNGWYSRSPHTLRRMGNNQPVSGVMTPLIKTGRASGVTNNAGVLAYQFPEAFPGGCVAVTLQAMQTIAGNPQLLGDGSSMDANGFSTFWPALAGASVQVPYIAIGY